MVLPVIVITSMTSIGMLMPRESNEKMGLQITLLLTLVFFIQLLQEEIPFWQLYKNTPKILVYFIVVMGTLSFTIILSAWTLYMQHMNDQELHNFGQSFKNSDIDLMKVTQVTVTLGPQIRPSKGRRRPG